MTFRTENNETSRHLEQTAATSGKHHDGRNNVPGGNKVTNVTILMTRIRERLRNLCLHSGILGKNPTVDVNVKTIRQEEFLRENPRTNVQRHVIQHVAINGNLQLL